EQSERRADAGRPRKEDGRDLEQLRQPRSVTRASAAKADEHTFPWIPPFSRRDLTDRHVHAVDGEFDNGQGRLDQIEPEGLAEARDGLLRPLQVERQLSLEKGGRQPSQNEVRIRNRRV